MIKLCKYYTKIAFTENKLHSQDTGRKLDCYIRAY